LARAAYIGGTNDDTEGHSPWEAIALNTPVFHGPRTQNFTADFSQLNEHGLSHLSTKPDELAAALNELRKNPQPETTLVLQVEQQRVAALAHDLCNLIEPSHD
jgi:3-deoxy-D-manno-octulosonic-acid transferase